MLSKTHHLLPLSVFIAFGLSGCQSSSGSDTNTVEQLNVSPIITALTENIIVDNYRLLNEAGQQLWQASLTFQNTPTEENLSALQQAWKNAREPWEQAEAHLFGPVDALSIDPHLDTWPLNTQDLNALLQSQLSISADLVKSWNDDVQGFHSIEYLIFGDGITDNIKTIDEFTDNEISYLVATVDVFQQYSQQLYDAWTVNSTMNGSTEAYQSIVINANNNFYQNHVAVLQELLNGMIAIIDEVAQGKLADALGDDIASADPSKVESPYSWNSLEDIQNNIAGVYALYRGERTDEQDNLGLIDFVEQLDKDKAETIEQAFIDTLAAIAAIKGEENLSYREAILASESRERIYTAIDKLNTLKGLLENDVLSEINKLLTQA
jgi:predicted lipoprotein